MKNFLALLIFILLISKGFSQSYLPLLEEENEWNVLAAGITPFPNWDTVYSTDNYKIMGDTVINSISYKKMYSSSEEIPMNWQLNCFFREDTIVKQAWMRFDNDDEEYLMYDFSVGPGDTVNAGQYEPVNLVVDSVKTIFLDETEHKKYWFTCLENPYYEEYWIEGIGSNQGIVWSGSAMIVGGFYRLLCLSIDDELYYMNPEYNTCYLNTVGIYDIGTEPLKIYPNPTTEHIFLQYPEYLIIKSITINDLSGRLVKELDCEKTSLYIASLTKGTYIMRIISNNGLFVKKLVIH